MVNLNNWKLDRWQDLEVFEQLVDAVGGPALRAAAAQVSATHAALTATLSPAQQALYLAAVDAVSDQRAAARDAAVRVALAHGVAIGAALNRAPEGEPGALMRAGAAVALAVFGVSPPDGDALAVPQAALDALARAGGFAVG